MKLYHYKENGIIQGPVSLASLQHCSEQVVVREVGSEKWRKLFLVRQLEEPEAPAKEWKPAKAVPTPAVSASKPGAWVLWGYSGPVMLALAGMLILLLGMLVQAPSLIIYLVLWVWFAAIAGAIAIATRYDQRKAMIGGFLLGPLAWIALLLRWMLVDKQAT